MSNRHLVHLEGLPLPIVVAALYDIADTPGPADRTRPSEPLTLDEAVHAVAMAWDDPGKTFELSQLKERRLELVVERAWRLDTFRYDLVHADGQPLAQAVVERLRELPEDMFDADFWCTPERAESIRTWALEALDRVAPGRAWRIRSLDHVVAPDEMADCAIEYTLVRAAWVDADDLVRSNGLDPRVALVEGHANVFGAIEAENPYLAEVGRKMLVVATEYLNREEPKQGAQRAWQLVPRQLAPALQGWGLQREALVLERGRTLS